MRDGSPRLQTTARQIVTIRLENASLEMSTVAGESVSPDDGGLTNIDEALRLP